MDCGGAGGRAVRRRGQVSGLVTLVTVFCALSLCVFTALALSAANREYALARLTEERAAAYYRLDRQAAEYAAALDPSRIPEGETVSATLPGEDGMALELELRRRGGGFEVVGWRSVYAGPWEPDGTLELWDAGTGEG